MTDTQAETGTRNPADDPAVAALVKRGMAEVARGKMSLSDLFATVTSPPEAEAPDLIPPAPPTLNDEVKAAIARLPQVFGKVAPKVNRALTKPELKEIAEERTTINAVLGVLKKRKEEGIREALANHLDHLVTDDAERAKRDRNGHIAAKQDVPIDGTNLKVSRSVSGGKPNLTLENVHALHTAGLIDRKTYLAITKKPDYPRVLDEDGLHKAITEDPRLLFLLASWAEPTLPTTSITIKNDS